MKISSVKAQEILDSRGNPTVECVTALEDGSQGWAAVPSGASTGKYEAVELRDGDEKRYAGLGVLKAVSNVNDVLSKVVIGHDASDQNKLDHSMIEADGTENKSKLGANAILSVSMSVAQAEAVSEKKPLYEYLIKFNPDFNGVYTMPVPEMNVMNGGKHGNWATDIQEYMLFPIGAPSLTEAVRMNTEVYMQIKKILKSKKYSIAVGDEGGFAPTFINNEEPFQIMSEAVASAGYILGKDVYFGIDAAATEFYSPADLSSEVFTKEEASAKEGKDGKYILNKEGKTVTSDELSSFLLALSLKYPIISMEDVFSEDDWNAYQKFMIATQSKIQIVGDDLYVTNVKRLQKGIKEKSSNSILIKLNQIGTVSETIDAVLLARKNGMTSIISHRSGETEDTFIADFVVALGTGQIKTGAPARSERTAKYNRLMRIERELGSKAVYANLTLGK